MRMIGPRIDPQVSELATSERSTREHALDRLLHDPLWKLPFEDGFCGARLHAADKAGVMMIYLLLALPAGEDGLIGIDNDDIVAAVDVRSEDRQVLAAQPPGNDRGEAPDDQTLGVDEHPFFLDFGGLGRKSGHGESFPDKCIR